jgi:hypothetical protein
LFVKHASTYHTELRGAGRSVVEASRIDQKSVGILRSRKNFSEQSQVGNLTKNNTEVIREVVEAIANFGRNSTRISKTYQMIFS